MTGEQLPEKSDTKRSIYARIPSGLCDQLDGWAADRGVTRSAAVAVLLRRSLGVREFDDDGIPIPSMSWRDCANCKPKQACSEHRTEAGVYWEAVRVRLSRARFKGVTHD